MILLCDKVVAMYHMLATFTAVHTIVILTARVSTIFGRYEDAQCTCKEEVRIKDRSDVCHSYITQLNKP